VLINCNLGTEEEIIEKLKNFESVKEIHGTFGAYDIVAKVESKSVEALQETITWRIRKLLNITSTITVMGIDGQEFKRR
jgi:DNA-binding Lrp family transcriptional regulator